MATKPGARPHTTNAPINAILDRARPYIHGAKLAGAGDGGVLMLLARDSEAAEELKRNLIRNSYEYGSVVSYRVAEKGLHVRTGSAFVKSDKAVHEKSIVHASSK